MVGLALLALAPAAASAQAPARTAVPAKATTDAAKLTLIYEREVYTYGGIGRRDPFRPLTDDEESGPRFEELTLQGIIYSDAPGKSLALLNDVSDRVHRARVGDVLGDSRVLEITPDRVVFAVNNFGNVRQEMLELKKSGGNER